MDKKLLQNLTYRFFVQRYLTSAIEMNYYPNQKFGHQSAFAELIKKEIEKMKIKSLKAQNFPPIDYVEMTDMGDMVIIAGPNGCGKSKLRELMSIGYMRLINGAQSNSIEMELEITSELEETIFQKSRGDTLWLNGPREYPDLLGIYQGNSMKFIENGKLESAIVEIESNRSITTIQGGTIEHQVNNPDDSPTDINLFISRQFNDIWRTIVKEIHYKIASHTIKRGQLVDEALKSGQTTKTVSQIEEESPPPFEIYQNYFKEMLRNKSLIEPDGHNVHDFGYRVDGKPKQVLWFSTLSSGEQEVIKICFTMIHKRIRHSIIVMDEPELHLHPELTIRMIETLKKVGEYTNQFILITHSPALITNYSTTASVFIMNTENKGNEHE